MLDVAMGLHSLHGRCATVARIGAQVLVAPLRRCLALDDNGVEHRRELGHIVLIGSGHDDRQRDATPVPQQVALAALFSPDQSGSARPLLAPGAP